MKPTEINILGKVYTVTYCDKPSDVDMHHRKSLWGQVDYWSRSIRIYDNEEYNSVDVLDTILHEVIHAIASELHLCLEDEKHHDDLGLLALALADVMTRNGWLKGERQDA